MFGKDNMKQTLTLTLVAFGCASCAGMSRTEKIRYGFEVLHRTCELAGVYPAEVPAEIRPELEAACLGLGAGKAEAVEEDAGAE